MLMFLFRIHHVVPHTRRPNFTLQPISHIALRLPALYLLANSIGLVLSKAAHGTSEHIWWANIARRWLTDPSKVNDATILWRAFVSLTIACLSEAFVRALNQE